MVVRLGPAVKVRYWASKIFKIIITEEYTVGWVDIGTRTKVPMKFVTYL
jgi:hypothetical protein